MEKSRSRILIIQTAFLGDLLLGIPLFKELRSKYPNHELILFCRKGVGDFILKSNLVDQVIEADKSSKNSWNEAKAKLKSQAYDFILCPHESMRSLSLVFGLKAKKKIGFRKFYNGVVFDDLVERPMELPEALRQLSLLAPIDSNWAPRLKAFAERQKAKGGQASESGDLLPVPEWASMTVPRLKNLRDGFFARGDLSSISSAHAKEMALKITSSKKPLAFLAPGSVWRTKMWTAIGYAETARELLNRGYQTVIIGAPNEKEICQEVADQSPGSITIAGEVSLFESAELLSLGDILISNDSGSMHMAAAGSVPSVSVFGPTVLEFGYRPWQTQARVVQVPRSELKCRPCGTHGAKECPLGHHLCMKQVSSAEVLAAAKELT